MSNEVTPSPEQLERLEKALNFSNTMQTFNLNKNNLKVKTQNLLNFSSNGGTFKVSQELIGFVKFVVDSGKDTTVILDKNDIPVRIDDTKKFLEDISSLYLSLIHI